MTRARSAGRSIVLCLGAIAAIAAVVMLPAHTRQGVDFHVSTLSIPAYVKVTDFVDRHWHYGLLAREVAAGQSTDRARAVAIYRWTREHVRHAPDGWPIVDDHILHIIIRGYGQSDQLADVFTTLTSYAGLPSYWIKIRRAEGNVIFSLVNIDGRWTVFDVWNDFAFLDERGDWPDATQLAADPTLADPIVRGFAVNGRPYADYLAELPQHPAPHTTRAELQMPWPRVLYEVRRAVGLERADVP